MLQIHIAKMLPGHPSRSCSQDPTNSHVYRSSISWKLPVSASPAYNLARQFDGRISDLLDEVHVLVSPDKRVSRGLKAIYRRSLLSRVVDVC